MSNPLRPPFKRSSPLDLLFGGLRIFQVLSGIPKNEGDFPYRPPSDQCDQLAPRCCGRSLPVWPLPRPASSPADPISPSLLAKAALTNVNDWEAERETNAFMWIGLLSLKSKILDPKPWTWNNSKVAIFTPKPCAGLNAPSPVQGWCRPSMRRAENA